MNVFVDFHHTALLRSLIMLFEGRLGGKVYRPIGLDWHSQGFWKVYDHPATAQQFLSLDQGYRPVDGTPPLNQFVKPTDMIEPEIYYCADPENETYNKAITLEEFKKRDWDIVIASMPQHIEPFQRLIREHAPKAKLIFQVGNNWNVPAGIEVKNVMASAKITPPEGVHFIEYHQEFNLSLFEPDYNYPEAKIHSFVNIIQNTADWPIFETFSRWLPEYDFKAYGGQCPDGVKAGPRGVAEGMREARFIWHLKPGGDGFGHVIHNAFASGRPVILRSSHYRNQLAEALIEDGVTCIDLDRQTPMESVLRIREIGESPTRWYAMAEAARQRFEAVVNYEKEAEAIKGFIAELA